MFFNKLKDIVDSLTQEYDCISDKVQMVYGFSEGECVTKFVFLNEDSTINFHSNSKEELKQRFEDILFEEYPFLIEGIYQVRILFRYIEAEYQLYSFNIYIDE